MEVVTATSLALEIRERIAFGELIESQPYVAQLLKRAIFGAARDVLAAKLTGGDPGQVIRSGG